ncbi:MAG TPA: endonuclease/exonuclease/phosphatase family protein [Acidimicrobiales bacterium]|nr:endonuclease/exonuclease/phosphatase family protein [Acidimicrobiales bacterium]
MRIATLNVRNTADRWRERRSLLVRQLVDLAPDVLGVQEVRTVPDQAAWIAREAERQSEGRLLYRCYRRAKTGRLRLWEGIAVLSRAPVVATAWIDLGVDCRVAQRVTVRALGGDLLDVYNTHLAGVGEEARRAQAGRILDWMGTRRPLPAVLLGDLNARPGSPTVDLLCSRLRSAHVAVHGREPEHTVPTPLRAGWSGAYSVLDYVFVNDEVEVEDARVAFDQLDPADPTLAASDHFGLVVTAYCSPASPAPPQR